MSATNAAPTFGALGCQREDVSCKVLRAMGLSWTALENSALLRIIIWIRDDPVPLMAEGVQELFTQLEAHIKAEAHDDVFQVPRHARRGRAASHS